MLSARSLVSRLSRRDNKQGPRPWYTRFWVTLAAMYAFLPLGLYLMWRYRPWPRWFKWLSTIMGTVASVIGAIIARRIL